MGRREQRAELESTWMVMREPQQRYPSRKERRANLSVALAESRRATRAREAAERTRVVTAHVPTQRMAYPQQQAIDAWPAADDQLRQAIARSKREAVVPPDWTIGERHPTCGDCQTMTHCEPHCPLWWQYSDEQEASQVPMRE